MNKEISKKQFIIYIAVAFILAYITEGISCYFANKGNTGLFTVLNMFTMFAPTIAVLVAQKNLKKLGWKPVFKGKIRFYVAAWFLPALFTILGAVLFFVVFPNAFDTTGMYLKQTIIAQLGDSGESYFNQMIEAGITPTIYALIQIAQALTFAPILNGILALGEEIGWRGYMTPYLKGRFGKTVGRIVAGLIWGVWHWPLIIFAGYEYGTDYFGAPYAGPFAFCVVCVILGSILDYLYEKTECIFVPAISHGAFNAIAAGSMMFFNPDYTNYSILGPAVIGIISMIPMAIYAIIILVLGQKKKSE